MEIQTMSDRSFIDAIIDLKEKHAKTTSRKLRFKEMLRIGLGGTVGGPIFVILGLSLAQAKAGLLISLAINGLLMISFVANYSELALSLSISGGGYQVFKKSLGPGYEFMFAWIMWLGNMAFAGLSSLGFVYSIKVFFPALELTEKNIDIISVVILLFFYVMNMFYPKKLNIIMKYLTISLVAGFVFYIVVGLSAGSQLNNEFSTDMFQESIDAISVLSQTAFTFIIFTIYEWLSSFTMMMEQYDKLHRPKENLPKTYLTAIIIGVILYWMVTFTTILNVGGTDTSLWEKVTTSDVPMVTVFGDFLGTFGIIAIGIVGMIATLTSINAGMQMCTHLLYSMGRDEFMPQIFKKTRKNVRYVALTFSTFIAVIITIVADVDSLTNFTSFVFLVSMGFLCIAVIMMRRSSPNLERPWKVPGYPFTPIISGVACLVLVLTFEISQITAGLISLAIGVVFFVIWVYVFNHSAVLERESIIEQREDALKDRELNVLLMKSKLARKMADQILDSTNAKYDEISEEKINFIQRLKDFEAIENRDLSSVEQIEEAKEDLNDRLEKLSLILRLEELERLEQKSREDISQLSIIQEEDGEIVFDTNNLHDGSSEENPKVSEEAWDKKPRKKGTFFGLLKNLIQKDQSEISDLYDLDDLESTPLIYNSEGLIERLEKIEVVEKKLLDQIQNIQDDQTKSKEEKESISSVLDFLNVFKGKGKKKGKTKSVSEKIKAALGSQGMESKSPDSETKVKKESSFTDSVSEEKHLNSEKMDRDKSAESEQRSSEEMEALQNNEKIGKPTTKAEKRALIKKLKKIEKQEKEVAKEMKSFKDKDS